MKLEIATASASYPIVIGHSLLTKLPEYLKQTSSLQYCQDVLLISNDVVYPLYGKVVSENLESSGRAVYCFILPDGESYKSWSMAEQILTFAIERKLPRKTVVVALGGGVVGDLAGFVAAVYLRGVPLVQVPTTLLAQVDSSIGGKVAVNHPLGKNLIGAFYQPHLVISDLDTLYTLPEREWRSGLAEVIKYGIIWDNEFFCFLEQYKEQILNQEPEYISAIVRRCCEIKAEVVSQDEKEQGLRTILNFGHTVGHALESATEYQVYRHGEAVAIGMVVATRIAQLLGRLDVAIGERIINLIEQYHLPTRLPDISPSQLIAWMQHDKKVVDQKLTFVLPVSIGKVSLGEMIDQSNWQVIEEAIQMSQEH